MESPEVAAAQVLTLADAGRLLEQARSLDAKGRWAAAEQLYRQALTIQQRVQGPEGADVANTLDALGDLYATWGRSTEAESSHRRALAIHERALPSLHPRVATSLDHLGSDLTNQGRYAEAE